MNFNLIQLVLLPQVLWSSNSLPFAVSVASLFFFPYMFCEFWLTTKFSFFLWEWCEDWDSSVPPELFCICFLDFPPLNAITACDQLACEWLLLTIPAFLDNVHLASKRGRLGVSLSCRFWRASKIFTVFLRVVVWLFCGLLYWKYSALEV